MLKARNLKIVHSQEDANLVTHGGTFHMDEVMATAILIRAIPGDGPLTLFRVTGNNPLPEYPGQMVYDVGMGAFDHHQRGGNGIRENGIPFASAGLIWRAYGKLLCTSDNNEIDVAEVADRVDRELIQPIDAQDTGFRNPLPAGFKPTPSFSISQLVSSMNPNWDESGRAWSAEEGFIAAVRIAGILLERVIERNLSKLAAKKQVYNFIRDSTDGIMYMPHFVPWEEFIFPDENTPEDVREKAAEILYVVYPGNRGDYQFRVVPDKPGSFGQRNELPDEWKGLKGAELNAIMQSYGIATATFIHPAGFIGGAVDASDAMKMAYMAIEMCTRNV